MEASAARCFSDPGMDLPSLIHPWEMDSLDQLTGQPIWESFPQSFSSESYSSHPSSFNPLASATSNSWNSCTTEQNSFRAPDHSLSPSILSFGTPPSPMDQLNLYASIIGGDVKPKQEVEAPTPRGSKRSYEMEVGQVPKRMNTASRPPSHMQDHIMAERKRREKLTQRFIALSAIIPGLKKMDKASVLGDAIKHLKHLQEKVKTLEEQTTKRTVESVVIIKKSQLSTDDDSSSCDENSDGQFSGVSLPEIEVKLSEKSVLVRIHCDNHKGILAKAISEVEKLHLTIVSTSAMPFTSSSLDVTIMAKMDEEFSMTLTDLVKKLNSGFRQFM